MNDDQPILSARGIYKAYLEPRSRIPVETLHNISVNVSQREFVSVIGPSGSGKSTFLRIVAGLDKPSAGEIIVAGKQVSRPGADRGMVFQEYALLPWKTMQKNVEFGLLLKGVSRTERADIARHFIARVGLTGAEHKYPHQLSGGMRQRAAVARALANNPAILLMDEPFAAVDAMTRQRLQEELAVVSSVESTTVLFVTHAIEEAVLLSDRVVVLSGRPGRVVADVRIELSQPRRWTDLNNDPKFGEYCSALTEYLSGSTREVQHVS